MNRRHLATVVTGSGILLLIALPIALSFRHQARPRYVDRLAPSSVLLSRIDGETIVPQWRVIGPIQYIGKQSAGGPTPEAISRDVLTEIGTKDSALTERTIEDLCSRFGRLCATYNAHGAVLPFGLIFPETRNAIVYASAVINCAHDMRLVLEVGNSSGVSVRLNGAVMLSVPQGDKGGTALKYRHMLPMDMHKGANLLLIKSDSGDGSEGRWALIASLMSMESARSNAVERANGYLISNRLVKAGETLLLPSVCAFCGTLSVHITLADWTGKAVLTQGYAEGFPIRIGTTGLREGFYTATIRIGPQSVQDEFYIGDPERIINSMERRQRVADFSSQEYLQRNPMIKRYRILMSKQYYHPLDSDWQRKMLLVLKDAVWEEHEPSGALWTKRPGMHLREYISKIDNAPQYYMLYVPNDSHDLMPLAGQTHLSCPLRVGAAGKGDPRRR